MSNQSTDELSGSSAIYPRRGRYYNRGDVWERASVGRQYLRNGPNSTALRYVSPTLIIPSIHLLFFPGDVIQAVVRSFWPSSRYNLLTCLFGQDHCVLEDDVSLLAMGVSELGDETTIKVWVSEREETGQTPTPSEHRVGDPRQYKVPSEALPSTSG